MTGSSLLRASVVALAVLAGTCAPADTGSGRGAASLVRSEVARANADPAAGSRAAGAVEALAADLYGELGRKPGDLLFSPYSVEIALAMARAGAGGRTADEMDRVLHASAADLDAGLNALDQALATRSGTYPFGQETVGLELATADQLFGQRGFAFETPFLDRLAASYGAGMRLVDYIAAREEARAGINAWVAGRTHDRIPKLIPEGVLDAMTRLVITNALYFKGKWAQPFAKNSTAPASFHRLDGTTSQAQLMALSSTSLGYATGTGYTAVQLPYVGGVSMIVIAPDTGAFAAVESRLKGGALIREVVGGIKRDAGIRLRMPKFTFRSQSLLKPALGALGMPTAFTDQADFRGISKADKLRIQDVVHEAFIAVDEDGTEAAAATAVVFGVTSAPSKQIELTIDRPFFFVIRDDSTGTILFLGRVVDPA